MVHIVFNWGCFLLQFTSQLQNTPIISCFSNAIVCHEFDYQIIISIGTFLAIFEVKFWQIFSNYGGNLLVPYYPAFRCMHLYTQLKPKCMHLSESKFAISKRRVKLIRFVHKCINFQTYHQAARLMVRCCYSVAPFVLKTRRILANIELSSALLHAHQFSRTSGPHFI